MPFALNHCYFFREIQAGILPVYSSPARLSWSTPGLTSPIQTTLPYLYITSKSNSSPQCDLCGKGFIHLKSYQIHKMIHSGERHIKCEVCSLALLSKSHLKQHMRVHTGERPHECEVCGKRFAKRSNLNAHKKKVTRHTGRDEGPINQ
jgi:Zinc finger, C2H2 type.